MNDERQPATVPTLQEATAHWHENWVASLPEIPKSNLTHEESRWLCESGQWYRGSNGQCVYASLGNDICVQIWRRDDGWVSGQARKPLPLTEALSRACQSAEKRIQKSALLLENLCIPQRPMGTLAEAVAETIATFDAAPGEPAKEGSKWKR